MIISALQPNKTVVPKTSKIKKENLSCNFQHYDMQKLSSELLSIYFTGVNKAREVKNGIIVPPKIVEFCQQQRCDLIGKTIVVNKTNNSAKEDAFIVIRGNINLNDRKFMFFDNGKAEEQDSRAKEYTNQEITNYNDYFARKNSSAIIFLVNKDGKVIGFDDITVNDRQFVDYPPFNFNEGYLFINSMANFTSSYFNKESKAVFIELLKDIKEKHKDIIAKDEYSASLHYIAASMLQKLGMKNLLLCAENNSESYHRGFGYVSYKDEFMFLPIADSGRNTISSLTEELNKNPILLEKPVHYSKLKPGKVYL